MSKSAFGFGVVLSAMLGLCLLMAVKSARADALTDLDNAFVDTYTLAAERTLADLRSSVPVLVNLADQIALYRPGVEKPELFSMDLRVYSQAKSVAHTGATLYVGLAPYGLGPLDGRRLEWLAKYQRLLSDAEAEIKSRDDTPLTLKTLQIGLLEDVRRFAARIQQQGSLDQATLDQMGATVREAVRKNLAVAAQSQLDQFRRQVAHWRELYPTLAWDKAVVVIIFIHQARDRDLQLQFFDWMMHDQPSRQDHVVYDENNSGPTSLGGPATTEALTLLSKVMMDKGLSSVMFGDPLALQWDVLADGAEATIKTWPPSDIK